jgi:predicted Zn finger-like uncharacterized protein
MIAQCPMCEARYRVDDSKVGPGGTKFKCKKCRNTFMVFREFQQQEQEATVRRAPTMKNCPHCGKPIPFQAIKCRYCREAVDKAAAGFEGQDADAHEGEGEGEGEGEHQDPFVPHSGPDADHQDPFVSQSGPDTDHQDPFVPQGGGGYSGENVFDSEDDGFGGAPGYGGPPAPGGEYPGYGGGGYGGGPAYQQATMPAGGVPNYLVHAILVTLFCCLPFGIVAIVYAAQVNGKLSGGDIDGAMESSRKAKMWSWISFGVGLGIVMYFILVMLRVAIQ